MYKKKPMGKHPDKAWRSVAIVSACFCAFFLARGVLTSKTTSDNFSSRDGKTLIVHIFADTDPEYLENLKFFVEWGIPVQDQADYVIVVQSTDSSTVGLSVSSQPTCTNILTHTCTCTMALPEEWWRLAACQATAYSIKCQICTTQE